MASIILVIIFSFSCFSQQEHRVNNFFDNYSKWGYTIAPIVFNKATITKDYGNIELRNNPVVSFKIGAEYHFLRTDKLNLSVGANITLTPLYNLSFTLKEEDVYHGFGGTDQYFDYGFVYVSIPLSIEFNKKLKNNILFNTDIGINTFFIPSQNSEMVTIYVSEELDEEREIFAIYQNTQKNSIQASAIFGVGFYFLFNKCMLKTNIIYNKSFQNLWQGEYQFGNLFVSEPTRGDYIVSGDYIGLSTTIYFKKKASQNKR